MLSTAVPQQSFVGVLLDDSRSMRIADDGEPRGEFVARRRSAGTAACSRRLAERFKLRLFRFAESPERLPSVAELAFDGGRPR